MRRQKIFEHVEYDALLDEDMLTRAVGGPDVMVDQLDRLLTLGQRTNIKIRIVPKSRGAHLGMLGAYLLLRFERGLPSVYIEQQASSAILDGRAETRAFEEVTAVLHTEAMSNAATETSIIDYRDHWKEKR